MTIIRSLQIVAALSVFFISALPVSATVQNKLTIEDFMADPDVYDAEFSPDGRYLAMILRKDKARWLIIRDFSKEGYPLTGAFKEALIRPSSIAWANNERLIVNLLVPSARFSRLVEKSKEDPDFDINKYQMSYRSVAMDVDTGNAAILVNNNRNMRRILNLSRISNYLENDEKHVLMPIWGRRSLELHKVNIYTGEAQKITSGSRRTYKFLADNNGRPSYRFDYYSYGKKIRVYEYTMEDDWEELDTIKLDQEDDDSINREGLIRFGFGENSNLIYRERNKTTGYYEIVQRNRNSDKKEVIASLPDKDIYSPLFGTRSGKYLGYNVKDDLIRNFYVDKATQEHYDIIAKEVGHVNFNVWASREHGSRVMIYTYGADDSGSFNVYDYDEKKLSFLSDKYSRISPEKLAMPGKLVYKTRDGTKIRMYVLIPLNYNERVKHPMVILPHGGPHVRDSSSYDKLAQFIATRGYIVVQPNFRGSSGYGLKFEEAGYKEWGGVMQDDLTDAVNFMVDKGYADQNRICIVGASYGGYAALMGAVKTPDLYQCSVSINGVSHLKDQIEFDIDSAKSNEEKVEEWTYKTIGHPKKDSKMLDDNSPALQADKINIPILIIAGEKDSVVPLDQSEMMVDALEDNDKEFLYFELEDTGHNVLYYKEDIEKVYSELESFLEKHLGKTSVIADDQLENGQIKKAG